MSNFDFDHGRSHQVSWTEKLLDTLEKFYKTEYQPLLNHEKTNLKNTTFLLPYLATQIHTSLSNNIQEHFIQHFLHQIQKAN